LSHSTFNKYIR